MNELEHATILAEVEIVGTRLGFIDSLTVWINKPHVVNRRLSGAQIEFFAFIDKKDVNTKLKTLLTNDKLVDRQNESKLGFEETSHSLLEVENLQEITETESALIVRKLITKSSTASSEIVCVEDNDGLIVAKFFAVATKETSENHSTYQLVFIPGREKNKIQLKADHHTSGGDIEWMKTTLLPKLRNWSAETKLKTSVTSLRLIPIDDYSKKYKYLKEKYGNYFVQNWPESTDPQKFVYEDIAIASYLLVLWEKEREKKELKMLQSFVDLGCGNGLLVHLLASEGHPGVGLDIRRRKIWDMYGKETILKEVTITPSAENTFPEYDWLIGNHSDELTPWIPVISARSSYTSRYFVLPCCHYDFDCKFSGKQKGESNYRTYLNFVKEVGEVCGFKVEEDTLRIPSTKRVCFIGQERSYSPEEDNIMEDKIAVYIKNRTKTNSSANILESSETLQESGSKYQKLENGQKWATNFEPRKQSKDKSRNCQHVDKKVKTLIINTVFDKVMESDKSEVRQLSDGRTWRKGGIVPLGEVVKLFDQETLKQLKSECGGLQTLLKNHNSIYNVSGGNVQLRDLSLQEPYSKKSQLSKKDRSQYFKTLPCWFYTNHPDGCPRNQETCTFAHGEIDLKNNDKILHVETPSSNS